MPNWNLGVLPDIYVSITPDIYLSISGNWIFQTTNYVIDSKKFSDEINELIYNMLGREQ